MMAPGDDGSGSLPATEVPGVARTRTAPAPAAASWIGPFEVIRELGSGGMGTVYLARQHQPLRREVAVKVIQPGILDARQALRFEAERQALARLSHPNVAAVYAAGTTELGQAWLAMEHVPGEPITAYCDRQRLSLGARLTLFVDVCRGVQHAHQKGILHRDLKPSNILVMEDQGRPIPKLIDFGIAKALDQPLVDGPALTRHRLLGTPGYIAPEVLLGREENAGDDTRVDVYALGLVLYQLLVGRMPFDLADASLVAALRQITEDDPPSLGARWRALALAEREAVAAARATGVAALGRQLAGELAWIVAMATARDREQRYASAAELAADVERHLRFEPVVAGAPNRLYRLRKLVRRHRAAAAAGVVVAISMVGGLVARTLEAERANREAERANREAASAREVSTFLLDLFEVSDPSENRGNTVTAREILDRGAERVRRDLADQPLTQAHLQDTIGGVYMSLGLHEVARPLMEEALSTRRRLLGAAASEVIESVRGLAILATEQGRFDDAEALLREALALSTRRTGVESRETAEIETRLAILLHNVGRLDEAITIQRRALASLDALGPPDERYLTGLNNLGTLYIDLGRLTEAEPVVRRTLALREQLLGPEHQLVAQSLTNLGILLLNTERAGEAKPLVERAVAIREKVLGPDHPNVVWALRLLGEVHRTEGRYEPAQAIFERCLRIQETALGPEHPFVALTLESLGNLARLRGDLEAARRYLERCLRIAEAKLDPQHPTLGYYLRSMANLERDAGRADIAEPLYQRAIAIFEHHGTMTKDLAETREELVLLEAGRPERPTGLEGTD